MQYYQDVDRLKLTLVSSVDKDEIINYFTGKIEFTDAINLELRQAPLFSFEKIFSSQNLKRPNRNRERGIPGEEKMKKIKRNEELGEKNNEANAEDQVEKEREQLRIVDFLNKIEKPIDSKSKALRKSNKSFKFALGLLRNLISEEPKQK